MVFYMIQLPDCDKIVWVWYKDELMTFYTSIYLPDFTEYFTKNYLKDNI